MPSATGGQASFLDQANGLHETTENLEGLLKGAQVGTKGNNWVSKGCFSDFCLTTPQ